jgi:hypothetical protein
MQFCGRAPARPAVETAPFGVGEHLHGAVEALLRLCRAEGLYPPQRDVEADPEAFAGWLMSEEVLGG